jgi:hypothetical protein
MEGVNQRVNLRRHACEREAGRRRFRFTCRFGAARHVR